MIGQADEKGLIRPIQFGSKRFAPSERKLSTTLRELKAIEFSLLKTKFFTSHNENNVTIYTDHKPLLGLLNQPYDNYSAQVQRILDNIGPFAPNVKYIKGKLNVVADLLSRYFFEDGTMKASEASSVEFSTPCTNNIDIPPLDLLSEQKNDTFCTEMVQFLQNGYLPYNKHRAKYISLYSEPVSYTHLTLPTKA